MTEQTRKRLGRPPRAENQRERILHEAAILFARSGFDASSLTELAEESGISKAGIYHYFKTKQEVYDAIILKTLQGLEDHVGAVVREATDPYDQLVAFMTAHADYFERNYWAFRAMLISFSAMSAPLARAEAVSLRERYERLLRGIIADGVARGDFRGVDPASAGRAVLSLLNWMARWYRPDGPNTAAAFALEYADLLLKGLHV
ncbi:MAG: TetR/AcrR family transcriptional regulator [Ktedonobacterales bacterium]